MRKKLTEWLWNGTFNLAWFVLSRLGCKRLEAWEDGDVWAEERLREALGDALTLFEDECTPDEPDAFTWLYEARDALAVEN